jgi:hypothetical protein
VESVDHWLGRSGSVMWLNASWHVLVKNRWVGPREQILNVLIACWYMGLVSLVASYQQKLDFSPLLY